MRRYGMLPRPLPVRRATPAERAQIARDASQGIQMDFDSPAELEAWMDDREWDLRVDLAEEMREGR